LGTPAKRFIREQCQRVLKECREQLSTITVEPSIETLGNGKRFVSYARVLHPSCTSAFDENLCAVLADNLQDTELRNDFIELLDLGEWALNEACSRAGREWRVKPIAIWRELIRSTLFFGQNGPSHALLLICHNIRDTLMLSKRTTDRFPLRDALLARLRQGNSGALGLLILMFDLRYRESVTVDDILEVARQAWNTNIETLQLEALELVHSESSVIRAAGAHSESAVVALLDEFDVQNNIMLSTEWCETRSCFHGFEIGLSIDDAVEEFRRILSIANSGDDEVYEIEREQDATLTFSQFIASWASATLGKIFEEVFQGVYSDAYELLEDEEKKRILVLALTEKGRVGLFTPWYMSQLIRLGLTDAEHILLRYGDRIESDGFCPQDCVATFIKANEAWARVASEPIPYNNIDSDDHRAWAIIGELVFWVNRESSVRDPGRIAFLCDELMRLPAALPDVLRHVASLGKWTETGPGMAQLMTQCREPIARALAESLGSGGSLTSVFRGAEFVQSDIFREAIHTLGDIGNRESIDRLRPFTNHPVHGRDAIQAIEEIEKRLAAAQ
jgi:hypothetical protein